MLYLNTVAEAPFHHKSGASFNATGYPMSHYTTFEERLEIENGLRENLSFGEIAKRLGKNRSTISREVRKYALPEF